MAGMTQFPEKRCPCGNPSEPEIVFFLPENSGYFWEKNTADECMKPASDNETQFRLRFRIALILSLSLCIAVFYFFPRFGSISTPKKQAIRITIQVSEIPPTHQPLAKRPARPPVPEKGIPVVGEEAEFPEDLPLSHLAGETLTIGQAAGKPVEIPARPLLDVYPDISTTSCKGVVRLLLLVNRTGKIEAVEVLENTTGSQKCLSLAIQAARRSRWLPARINQQPVDSWVTKTYKFNLEE
jgi:TonB family protein